MPLKSHDDYVKALDLTVAIGDLNVRVQRYLIRDVHYSNREAQLAKLSDELEDRSYELYNLLKQAGT